MKPVTKILILLSLLLFPAFCLAEQEYVGSETCLQCHPEEYSEWQASGHPWKLRKAGEAKHAKLPLPPGYNWNDISYVIGGVNTKAIYVDTNGYLVTSAKDGRKAKTQYNLEDGSWSYYHPGQKKKYDCAYCHTTGYNPKGSQDGLKGIVGTWNEDGIGCEACHGPGGSHAKEPGSWTVMVDRTAEACGDCHQRGGIGPNPLVEDGFILHQEQLNELQAGTHRGLKCVNCHNPHQRAVQVRYNCMNCHAPIANAYDKNIHAKSGIKCFECHMPKATKSAISRASYIGDVRTHLYRINTDPQASMFKTVTEKGKTSTFARGFVTLDFACLGCHGSRDREWAAGHARNFHERPQP